MMSTTQAWRKNVAWPTPHPEPWAGIWPLSCGFHDAGSARLPKPWPPPQTPSWHCPHLIMRGRLCVVYGAAKHATLGPGAMFTMFKGMPLVYHRKQPDSPVRLYWARLGGPMSEAYLNALGFSVERPFFRARDPQLVKACFLRLLELGEHHDPYSDMAAVSTLHHMARGCPPPHTRPRSLETLAERARQFMAEELERGLNVNEIARAFGVSRSCLLLRFREAFDQTPLQVMTGLRLSRARALLAETALSIAEIGRLVGYADPLHFSRRFRQVQGMPPSEFRTTHARKRLTNQRRTRHRA